MLLVTGSQADRSDRNKITLLKLSDVHKTKLNHDDDEGTLQANVLLYELQFLKMCFYCMHTLCIQIEY